MISWEQAANIITMDKCSVRLHRQPCCTHHLRSNSNDNSPNQDIPICYDDPPIISGVPINNPRPPGITHATRLASAKDVYCN